MHDITACCMTVVYIYILKVFFTKVSFFFFFFLHLSGIKDVLYSLQYY